MKKYLLFLILCFTLTAEAQDCSFILKGKITDELTNEPLAFATVFIEETQQGVSADENGNFIISKICLAEVHVRITHVSCETEKRFIDLRKTNTVNWQLHHHNELLNELQVHGKSTEQSIQTTGSISGADIIKNGQENLGNILETLTGVTVIKTGAGITKPVIQGLYGNRISILNNGIAQSGQQWGVDHAPEIDPFTADHLSVIKGVSALAYGGNTLGGVVMVESKAIANEPHLHGAVNYLYNTNGHGQTLNGRIEKAGRFFNWRLNGTLKMQGDTHTPDYFLTNTARREGNFSVQIGKKLSDKWNSSAYYSNFNAEIGILKGSQIGNLTDLTTALSREIPFFTEDNFSYQVNPPKQRVNHQLLKLDVRAALSPKNTLRFTYGGQLNQRKEFDVRRGGRSDIPELSLAQWSHFFEGNFIRDVTEKVTLNTGVQYTYTDNTNVPGTGITPLIPDYRSFQTSAYGILSFRRNKFTHEIGGRLDNKQLNVVRISRTLPREILRDNLRFNYFSISGGSSVKSVKNLTITGNIGVSMRPPEINELFSFGLHQGVSSIEEGNEGLKSERSIKSLLTINYSSQRWIFLEITPYVQRIDNYIYLQPQADFMLTIRGAFPYFKFAQTNAVLWGTDALLSIEPTKKLKIINKLSFVKGNDLSEDIPLINIPPLNVSSALQLGLKNVGKFENNALEIEVNHTARQKNLLATQDFVLPPPAYTLLNASFDTDIQLKKSYVKFGVKATNLLNVRYRNYLNRLRYFADDMGRNMILRVMYNF